jgi:hypothetical protein
MQRKALREAKPMVSVTGALSGKPKLRPRNLVVSLGILCSLAGCNEEASDPEIKALQCAKRQYADFNPKNMQQCVDVCITCGKGTVTTCSTSCTVRGAK